MGFMYIYMDIEPTIIIWVCPKMGDNCHEPLIMAILMGIMMISKFRSRLF